jgi:hypothetical protein
VQGNPKVDYHLSNAPEETPLEELARVATAEHRIEECIKRSKSEAGMADYEVRTWWGWHHHQTLSLIATWFLVCEARRGKNGLRPSRFPRFARGWPCCCIELVVAAIPIESLATERADCSATNLLDSTITNDATSWPPYVFINAHERKQYN